ncbi:MAG: hypothetical protein COX44_02530 [Candidatus Portnoybacteria bacterium CG23_combo_of_CG06-09_8_20_14_all_37_13]|uniref:Prepilin-type cleavage/methylation domain-containing protein n=1 Tax=Candidatus Portnoybacteria bacterium CG23_combo_of_CG06-09_8_20_14_all_37_13 TaxID=1974819 RepID=A0A2G9YCL6_9BACT|nr:MAG: hypothetical protein COX44_02530 [Candidatus Portnoybacteria bacterium CG23_combo_of_CG06-09_8_20_14_all_37_13]
MSKAFSLLEVLIAMAIITIGLVAALNLIAFSLHSYKTSSQQIIDTNWVQGCLEAIRNQRDRGECCLGQNPYVATCTKNNITIKTYLYDWQ